MGTVPLEVVPKVALVVELEIAPVVSMSRNEEDIGKTKSTFSLLSTRCSRVDVNSRH